jgi:hypothetical protein
MTERRITLIDVENGMFDLSLHTILTPPCFTFFWGIIQTCNRFKPRFKNPFTLTLAQATAAGGGISRQAIWDKQQRLNKVMVDGRSLITITAGSRKDNKAAKYNINYKLIVPEKPVVIESTEIPSNIIDELRTICGRSGQEPSIIIDDLLTFLRSDQIRGDQIPPTPQNVSTKQVSSETEEAGGGLDSSEEEEELRMIQTHPAPSSALSLVCVRARKIQGEGNGPVTRALVAEREREIGGLKADLEEARKNPDDNAAFISQHEHILELKVSALERLKTE